MSSRIPIIERAYQLAMSGAYRSVGPIKDELKREGYVMVDAHIAGPSLTATLRRLCAQAGELAPLGLGIGADEARTAATAQNAHSR
jgi:hypothetical protein